MPARTWGRMNTVNSKRHLPPTPSQEGGVAKRIFSFPKRKKLPLLGRGPGGGVIFFILFIVSVQSTLAQPPFRVMFYNVENLFDTEDNPDKADEEFTPAGARRWTNKRYYKKINNIAKVISSVGEWDTPALVGLCEVENGKVLDDLTKYSPLKKRGYRYVITEPGDARGINVALLYERERFRYLSHESIQLHFPDDSTRTSRDILHVSGQLITRDTLDVFVCHFPSRRDGQWESEPNRILAASVLKAKTDSLMLVRANPYIIIMGDFNDEPRDKSLSKILKAEKVGDAINPTGLYNLFWTVEQSSHTGTYKYRQRWNFLDQIIVSGSMLEEDSPIKALPQTATIYQPAFLLTRDKTHGGKRPKKTYHGYKYEGGYSDHLPIWADVELRIKN